MKILGFTFIILLLTGCAQKINYNPYLIPEIDDALTGIEQSINTNPMKRGVMLEYADENKFKLIGSLPAGAIQKIVFYNSIDHIKFHKKRSRYSVGLFNNGDIEQHRFYFYSEHNAKILVNALYTLKNHTYDKNSEYLLVIKYGEKVNRVETEPYRNKIADENKTLKNMAINKPQVVCYKTFN